MSYAGGGDLFTALRRRGMSERVACFYAAELILGLRYLHSQRVTHR
jgi:serine/threonine protein kinase